VATNKEGIRLTNESLKSTFGSSVEQLLTVRIKYVAEEILKIVIKTSIHFGVLSNVDLSNV